LEPVVLFLSDRADGRDLADSGVDEYRVEPPYFLWHTRGGVAIGYLTALRAWVEAMFKYFLCTTLAAAAGFAAGCISAPQNKLPATPENYNAHSLRCKDLATQTITTNVSTGIPIAPRWDADEHIPSDEPADF
jgi:hypothetical protein